jgi:cellulose synthase/poly-beta-1,6-N-acetylglucosamine synthase-like glycosyltransferase
LTLHWTISILALVMALFTTPLFLDLALCIAGNLRRTRQPEGPARRVINLAVVIPAHDEEALIARAVASVLASDPDATVFVVAHNCSDSTAEKALNAGASVIELSNSRLRGKGAALRYGFASALASGANAMLVIDADSTVSANLIDATRAELEAGAQATQCRYELELPSASGFSPMSRLRSIAFLGMNVLRARGRAGFGFSTGLFGNGFSITAEALARVPFASDSIAEDVEYHTRLAAADIRVHWVGNAYVRAGLAAPGSAQASQEARWEGGRLSIASRCTPRLVSAAFHGRWRALETLIDIWSLPLSRGVVALVLQALMPLQWMHIYAAAGAAIVVLYVVQAAMLGPDPLLDLAALAAAPIYILWKAAITPLVLRQSRSSAAWVRTHREVPEP